MDYPQLRVAVAQIAPEVGNMDANLDKIKAFHLKAIESARESAMRRERWGARYDGCLQEELRKCEEQMDSNTWF